MEALTQDRASYQQIQQIPQQAIDQDHAHTNQERFQAAHATLFIGPFTSIGENQIILDRLSKQCPNRINKSITIESLRATQGPSQPRQNPLENTNENANLYTPQQISRKYASNTKQNQQQEHLPSLPDHRTVPLPTHEAKEEDHQCQPYNTQSQNENRPES